MDELEQALNSIKRDYKSMLNSMDNMLETTEDMQDALGMPRKRSLVPPTQKSSRPVLRQPRQLQRKVVAPTYSNKAMMQRQIGEIKSSLHPYHITQFNDKYDELASDPVQQEGMVAWYHARLKNGIIGF